MSYSIHKTGRHMQGIVKNNNETLISLWIWNYPCFRFRLIKTAAEGHAWCTLKINSFWIGCSTFSWLSRSQFGKLVRKFPPFGTPPSHTNWGDLLFREMQKAIWIVQVQMWQGNNKFNKNMWLFIQLMMVDQYWVWRAWNAWSSCWSISRCQSSHLFIHIPYLVMG